MRPQSGTPEPRHDRGRLIAWGASVAAHGLLLATAATVLVFHGIESRVISVALSPPDITVPVSDVPAFETSAAAIPPTLLEILRDQDKPIFESLEKEMAALEAEIRADRARADAAFIRRASERGALVPLPPSDETPTPRSELWLPRGTDAPTVHKPDTATHAESPSDVSKPEVAAPSPVETPAKLPTEATPAPKPTPAIIQPARLIQWRVPAVMRGRWRGTIEARISVEASGRVEQVELTKGTDDEAYDRAIIAALISATYHPATSKLPDGEPVAIRSVLLQEIMIR